MGLPGFMLSLYKWDRLSDQRLLQMLLKVQNAIVNLPLDHKDNDKILDAEEEIIAEMKKRGIWDPSLG